MSTRIRKHLILYVFLYVGAIGDWKNYFSKEQNERLNKLYQQKIADSGLELIFEL